MARIQKYVIATTALAAVLAAAPTVSYAAAQGTTAHSTQVQEQQHRKAPKPRIVQPGEHVVAAPGFELWLTAEGKHWTTPDMPDFPQFRSVVDGNIDLSRPGVSIQATGQAHGDWYLSGIYYGGKGTASYVEVETEAGPVYGKLLELPGKPGWGVWYATTTDDRPSGTDPWDFLDTVTVYDTKGRVYSQLPLS
ncbi:hypothetical protein [Streptomyces sp. NPDC002845]